MAKQKTESTPEPVKKGSAHEAEIKKSVGSMMKGGASQRERNLAIKAEMIKKGLHPESNFEPGMTTKEKNLTLKATLHGKDKGK